MKLSDRSLGWLRYLHRKAHTADDWSEFGHPHPHWDGQSQVEAEAGQPDSAMTNGRRFDLVDSSFAMGLMAHTTPAWTEPYVAVLDELIARQTGWWAIHDPDPANDPNGLMLVLLGIRSMIGDDRFAQTHNERAERVAEQPMAGADQRPSLRAAASLGLELHDRRHGTNLLAKIEEPRWGDLDSHALHEAMATAFLAAPLQTLDSRQWFERVSAGLEPALPADRTTVLALLLAKEWGMVELEQRLVAAIEASYEPTWNEGEFTWGLGLNEPHPRGQLNAILAAAEAGGPNAWGRLAGAPLEPWPQVVDVDFPNMALDRAEWIEGNLHLGLAPRVEDPTRSTSFRVVGAEPRIWDLHGIENARMESRLSGLNVRVPMVKADVTLIRSSY